MTTNTVLSRSLLPALLLSHSLILASVMLYPVLLCPALVYAIEVKEQGGAGSTAAEAGIGSATNTITLAGVAVALPFAATSPLPGAVAMSADGRIAAHISASGQVLLWDAGSLQTLGMLEMAASKQPDKADSADKADDEDVEAIAAAKAAAFNKRPTAVALSADGKLLATGYADARVEVRSVADLRLLHALNGHTASVTALRFSANGRQLASGSMDATARLWELASGRSLYIFDSLISDTVEPKGGSVIDLSFSADGHALIVNEWYSRFYDTGRGSSLWDIDTGLEIGSRALAPPNYESPMRTGHALGGKGWLLAYTGYDGLMVERLDTCQPARQMPAGAFADTVAVDTLGRWVAFADEHGLHFFAASGSQQAHTQEHTLALPAKTLALQVAADGRTMIALLQASSQPNGNENFIFGRDAETVTAARLYRLPVPPALLALPPLRVSASARTCPISAAARKVQDFRLPVRPRQLLQQASLLPAKDMLTDHQVPPDQAGRQLNPAKELYFSRDGKLYAFHYAQSDLRNGVAAWQTNTGRLLKARFDTSIVETRMRVPGGWLGIGSDIHNLLTGKLVCQSKPDDGFAYAVADQDTGDVFRPAPGYIQHYRATGQRMPDIKASARASATATTGNAEALASAIPAIAARNGRLAALYGDGSVDVWKISKSAFRQKPVHYSSSIKDIDSMPGQIVLSADGKHLQVEIPGEGDASTYYISFQLGSKKIARYDLLLSPISSHGNRAALADSRTHRLAVLDIARAKIIARLPRQASAETAYAYQPPIAAISEDGRLLANASSDGLLRIWNLETHQLLGEAHAGKAISALAFDLHGKQVAAGLEDGEIRLWHLPSIK